MSKYIDSEKLKEKIYAEDTVSLAHGSLPEFDQGCHYAFLTVLSFIASLQQETSEISLEKFTEKMDNWKARYNYPDNIPIKATMAFTARMFDMYPDVARQWYDNLPKVTLD